MSRKDGVDTGTCFVGMSLRILRSKRRGEELERGKERGREEASLLFVDGSKIYEE